MGRSSDTDDVGLRQVKFSTAVHLPHLIRAPPTGRPIGDYPQRAPESMLL